MSCSDHPQSSWPFSVEGQFLGFRQSDGKLKYLHLEFQEKRLQIKLPKELRSPLRLSLQPGDWIRVVGIGKLDRQTRALKLKANHVTSFSVGAQPKLASSAHSPLDQTSALDQNFLAPRVSTRTKVKILVCQKSSCFKRGGKQLLQAIEQTLRDRNLQDQIMIQHTGCLKRCSSPPNFVIMPGNHRYCDAQPEAIPALLDKYL